MSTYKLNFSLTTDEQRCNLITSICSQTTFTPIQYTQMADYILLGNNTTSTTCIVYPEEFSSPHVIHTEPSLDELMENEIYSEIVEAQIQPISPTIYKKNIRKINRDNPAHAAIPGMAELWNSIDYYKQILSQEPNNYKLKKLYISLCQQQYTLLEEYLPTKPNSPHTSTQKHYFEWYKGILLNNGSYADLNLCEASHMAKFLIFFPDLKEYCTDLTSDLAQLIQDTEEALRQTTLTPLQQDILMLYQSGKTAKEMQKYIQEHHNRKITQAYLSVIMYDQIAEKVAWEYAEIYWSRTYKNNPTKWRICLCCKQKKLLTKHNFHKYSNKPGGYSLYCKECTKKMKVKSKE